MRRLVSAVVLVVFLSTTTFAEWALIPLDELVADSDLIVIGTLHSATENSEYEGKGYILIDEIITKDVETFDRRPLKPGDNLKITWLDNWACALGMHLGWENKKGVFLMKIQKDGTVAAGYPGRFRTLADLTEINQLLGRQKMKRAGRVEVSAARIINKVPVAPLEPNNMAVVVDVSPFDDSSLYRALFTALLSLGAYLVLYRSRFRIR
jgi:hypothetical protein